MQPQADISSATPRQAPSITDGLHTLSYSPNDTGQITARTAAGWQPVNEVNLQAWQEIDRHIAQALRKVADGKASCLYYYMVANQMNIPLLASYTRQPFWKIYLHLRPFFFNRLSSRQLHLYARLFQVPEDDLRTGRLRPAVYHTVSRHG